MKLALLVLAAAVCVVYSATPTRPVFATNWFDTNYFGQEVTQGGGATLKGAMYWQMDNVNGSNGFNRSAFHSSVGGESTFLDWDGKTTGTSAIYYFAGDYCDYWCPTYPDDQCDEAEAFCQYDLMNEATYNGQVNFNGTLCNSFNWTDYLGPIAMANDTLLVNAASPADQPVPVYRLQNLFPFGNFFGNIQQWFGDYQPQTPPASAWEFPTVEYCQQGDDDQCSDDAHMRRGLHLMPGVAARMNLMRYYNLYLNSQ